MTTGWKVAQSLEQLRRQLDHLAPSRSRAADGAIASSSHSVANPNSDHEPWWVLNGQAYVTARDFTHDPAGGLDCEWLAGTLRRWADQRVKYVIWNRRIMAGRAGPKPWVWRPYAGINAHTHHLHLSVVADARSLTAIDWQLGDTVHAPARSPNDDDEDDDMDATERGWLAEIHDEITKRLPNRRGDQGANLANGGADTVLGYAANADGTGYRASWALDRIESAVLALGGRTGEQGPPIEIDYDLLAAALLRSIAGRNPS